MPDRPKFYDDPYLRRWMDEIVKLYQEHGLEIDPSKLDEAFKQFSGTSDVEKAVGGPRAEDWYDAPSKQLAAMRLRHLQDYLEKLGYELNEEKGFLYERKKKGDKK